MLEGAGPLMFHGTAEKIAPVLWLNHDIIAKQLNALHPEAGTPGRRLPASARPHVG